MKTLSIVEVIEKLDAAKVPEFDVWFRKDGVTFWGRREMADALPNQTEYMLNGNYQIVVKREVFMKVAKITSENGVFYTNNIDRFKNVSDCKVEFVEMTEDEYSAIPASIEAAEFYQKHARRFYDE